MSFLLFSLSFELSDHNRQRAALMPMMVGMVVRMVAMMGSTEVHKLPAHDLKQLVLYAIGSFKSTAFLVTTAF